MSSTRADRLQSLAWLAVGAGLLWLLWLLSPILAPFVVAAVLAYICDPGVNWLVARRIPRALAVTMMIVGLGIMLMLLILILTPMVYREGLALVQRLPDLVDLLNSKVLPWAETQLGVTLQLDAGAIRKWLAGNWSTAQDVLTLLLARARSGGMALVGVVANLFLVPLVMFYLLQEWPRILGYLEDTVPRPWHARTTKLLSEVDQVMSEFLRGQLSVMLLLAIFYSIGLWLAGLRFALPVGVMTGLLVFIPFVGFSAGLLLALMAALLQAQGWPPIIGVAVVYSLGQLVESFLLTPYLVGERIGLHPLAVIFALMAFGELFGFVGVLVALPVSAALLVGGRELRTLYLESSLYRGDGDGAKVDQ